ncbi:hypothetical protein U6Z18_12335, partial [Cutibacterium acnes]
EPVHRDQLSRLTRTGARRYPNSCGWACRRETVGPVPHVANPTASRPTTGFDEHPDEEVTTWT